MNVAIVTGLYEGYLHTLGLRRELKHRGHSVVSLETADMIIVHSGGWLMIPWQDTRAICALVDPAYHDERPLRKKTALRFKNDVSILTLSYLPAYLWFRSLNLFYLIIKLPL